eukprot:s147_g33.t1
MRFRECWWQRQLPRVEGFLFTKGESKARELRRFGESQYLQLQQKVNEAQTQVKALTEDLAKERQQNQGLQRKVVDLQDLVDQRRERALVEEVEKQLKVLNEEVAKEKHQKHVLERKVVEVEEKSAHATLESERKERARVEEVETQIKELTEDLAEERARNEVMERKLNDLEEQEWSTRATLETERQERMHDTEICDLEARALRAEAEAEEARQMVERWKEWGDEQQLRELAAETERLERLKQVREDVSQQVEAARRELVAENRALQKRIAELENGSTAATGAASQASQVDPAPQKHPKVSRSLFEEQRLQLQNRCSEMENRAKAAERKLAEAQAQVADKHSLEEERKASAEKIASLEEAVREAAGHIADGNSRVACLRWQQVLEAAVRQRCDEALKEAWGIRAQQGTKELSLLAMSTTEVKEEKRSFLMPRKCAFGKEIWGSGILRLRQLYEESPKAAKKEAASFVTQMYGHGLKPVIVKPVNSTSKPFRTTKDGVISSLVGGYEEFPEESLEKTWRCHDKGFVVGQYWDKIRFDNAGISVEGPQALAMGHCFFTDPVTGNESALEYTFGYFRDSEGHLRINLHFASAPYQNHSNRTVSEDITSEELKAAQKSFGDTIVDIGKYYKKGYASPIFFRVHAFWCTMAPAATSKERHRARRGGHSALLLVLLVLGVSQSFVPSGFDAGPGRLQRRLEAELQRRRATQVEEMTETEVKVDPVEKLCAKLPLLTGRKNHTEESLDFKVVGSKVGTSVELTLPPLQYWQYMRGKGKTLRKRELPKFQSNADSLVSAKEQAAEAALSSLFRIVDTRLSSSNNQAFARVMGGIFNDGVEVAQIRISELFQGNFLYALAYLARQSSAESSKRILTACHVRRLKDRPDWLQGFVQQKQRDLAMEHHDLGGGTTIKQQISGLVMPQNTSILSVSADTQPNNLAAYMEKALREKGAVKLQLAGTKSAEQALLALRDLNLLQYSQLGWAFERPGAPLGGAVPAEAPLLQLLHARHLSECHRSRGARGKKMATPDLRRGGGDMSSRYPWSYKEHALMFVDRMFAYDLGPVLFKPAEAEALQSSKQRFQNKSLKQPPELPTSSAALAWISSRRPVRDKFVVDIAMSEANKEEIEKCKQIAQAALATGDAEKASRFLQKAKRMCPTDTSIDDLLAKAAAGAAGGSSPGASPGASNARAPDPTASEGPRHRASAASNVRTTKDGKQYTSEQMQLVQRILRTKDYYDILEVPKNANEEVAKKAYRKLALKLHPDKNGAPGADEAFKKLSKAFQCLTDPEKKQVYDTYGDEERMPQQQRHHYQQDFMTPEDLFAAFFGGGPAFHQHHHGPRHRHHHHDDGQMQRVQIFQALPVLLLVLLTLASNFAAKDGGSKFSFQPNNAYRNERSTATLNVAYYVTDDFEEHYMEGTRNLAEFDRQVEIYHIRSLHSDCDYQEKTQYKKVLAAKRRGSQEDLQAARNHPRPACKELERVKKKFPALFRSAMFMGGY